jgi:ABC-type multidrug transport system fused ATPase/permease subunit
LSRAVAKDAARESRRRNSDLTAIAEETLANAALVQLSGTEPVEEARFSEDLRAHRRAELRATKVRAAYGPAIDSVELLGGLAVIWVGSSQVRNGSMTIGSLLIFIA